MSPLKIYQQFLRRLTMSILFTLMDAVVTSVCLNRAFGDSRFWLMLGLTVPLVWTLSDIWKHTLADAAAMKLMLAAAEIEDQEPVKQVA
jgi:hypothetical protein